MHTRKGLERRRRGGIKNKNKAEKKIALTAGKAVCVPEHQEYVSSQPMATALERKVQAPLIVMLLLLRICARLAAGDQACCVIGAISSSVCNSRLHLLC